MAVVLQLCFGLPFSNVTSLHETVSEKKLSEVATVNKTRLHNPTQNKKREKKDYLVKVRCVCGRKSAG